MNVKAAAFDYERPTTVGETLALLGQHGDEAQVIAGGQSLVPMMAFRLSRPSVLIDLNAVPEPAGMQNGADWFTVGAMTRQYQVLAQPEVRMHMPGLAQATAFVGHHQTRNRGTIGGSIALADPAAENPAFALAIGARMRLASTRGERSIMADEFFQGAYMTAIAEDELLVAVDYPHWGANSAVVLDEITRRPGDFALAGLAVAVRRDLSGRIDRAGIAWFGMSADPARAAGAENLLIGQDAEALDITDVARQAVSDVAPKDDVHATSSYRRAAGLELATRVIGRALGRMPA